MSRMTLTVPRPRYRARLCASLCLRHDLAIRHAQLRRSGLQCAKFRRGFRYGRQNANGSKRRGTNTSSRPRDRPESTRCGPSILRKAAIRQRGKQTFNFVVQWRVIYRTRPTPGRVPYFRRRDVASSLSSPTLPPCATSSPTAVSRRHHPGSRLPAAARSGRCRTRSDSRSALRPPRLTRSTNAAPGSHDH
jgi:hypothetical protein